MTAKESMDEITFINDGIHYKISRLNFDSILSKDSEACQQITAIMNHNKTSAEFEFSRNRSCTTNIIEYFNGNNLHLPLDVCPSKFREELQFWGLSDLDISGCCYSKFISFFEELEMVRFMERREKDLNLKKETVIQMSNGTGWSAWRAYIWMILEHPSTSIKAKIFAVFSTLMVAMSVFALVAGTHDMFRTELSDQEWEEYLTEHEQREYGWKASNNGSRKPPMELPDLSIPMDFLIYMNWYLICYFTIELMCRIIFFPLKWKQFFTFLNILDAVAVIIMYIVLISNETDSREKYEDGFIDALRSLQIIRIFRIFRLAKYISGFRLLYYTFLASIKDLLVMLLCLLTAVLIYASLAFFSQDPAFPSIPDSCWWAIITLTTVGYGDVYPTSASGKVIASACAMTGVCMLAILIPSLVNNFLLFNSHLKVFEKKEQTKNKSKQTSSQVRNHNKNSTVFPYI